MNAFVFLNLSISSKKAFIPEMSTSTKEMKLIARHLKIQLELRVQEPEMCYVFQDLERSCFTKTETSDGVLSTMEAVSDILKMKPCSWLLLEWSQNIE